MSQMLLDADVLIDFIQGIPSALTWLASLQEPPIVSCFAMLEVIVGSRNKQERLKIERLLSHFPLVYPTEADINYALLEYSRYSLSHGIGAIEIGRAHV